MNKIKKISIAVIATLMLATPVLAIEALPTKSLIYVNGKEVKLEGYNIDYNNYFKLRDIAYALNGTEKQFEVSYDENLNAILLTSGKSYTVIGGELAQGGNQTVDASITNSKVIKDGEEKAIQAYNINDNNYFKLRDLGEKFNFGVKFNEATNSISIDTNKTYTTSNEGATFELGEEIDMKDVPGIIVGPSPEDLPEPLPDATPAPPLQFMPY